MRDRYIKIWKEYKPSSSAGGVTIEHSWPFFKQLQFLEHFLRYESNKSVFKETAQQIFQSQPKMVTTVEEGSLMHQADEEVENLSTDL